MKEDLSLASFDVTETKSEEGSEFGYFKGRATAFLNIDCYYCLSLPETFDDSLPSFPQRGFIGGMNHDWNFPIGTPLSAKVDGRFLMVEGEIDRKVRGGEDAWMLMSRKGPESKRPIVNTLSIGMEIRDSRILRKKKDMLQLWADYKYTPNKLDMEKLEFAMTPQTFWGEKFILGIRVRNRATLNETSPVTAPGNDQAEIFSTSDSPRTLAGGRPNPLYQRVMAECGNARALERKAFEHQKSLMKLRSVS